VVITRVTTITTTDIPIVAITDTSKNTGATITTTDHGSTTITTMATMAIASV